MDKTLYSYTLLSAGSATGSSQTINKSGRYCLSVAGTFGGTSVGIQMLGPDGSTWISLEDDSGTIAITSAKALLILLPAGAFRASITGGSGVSIYVRLDRVVD